MTNCSDIMARYVFINYHRSVLSICLHKVPVITFVPDINTNVLHAVNYSAGQIERCRVTNLFPVLECTAIAYSQCRLCGGMALQQ